MLDFDSLFCSTGIRAAAAAAAAVAAAAAAAPQRSSRNESDVTRRERRRRAPEEREFVVSVINDGAPKHVLVELVVPTKRRRARGKDKHKQRSSRTPGVHTETNGHFPTLRDYVKSVPMFRTPLTRRDAQREFVACDVVIKGEPLGKGAGGDVYRGVLDDAYDVAVKQINLDSVHRRPLSQRRSASRRRQRKTSSGSELADKDESELAAIEDALREAEAMLAIPPHDNVTRLLGVCLQPLALVVELIDGGSLDKVLGIDEPDAPKGREFSADECIAIALGTARGLAHLHSVGVIHRDVASRNILLQQQPLVPKVADFGMSRRIQQAEADEEMGVTESTVGPIKWMAPEQMSGQTRCYSHKTDVFSYAVLLTELCGNVLPFRGTSNIDAAICVVREGARTAIPGRTPALLRQVIEIAWQQDSGDRPSMAMIVEWLEQRRVSIEPVRVAGYDDVDNFDDPVQ